MIEGEWVDAGVPAIIGDTVAAFGLGGVGHMAIQFAGLTGADFVAIGRSEDHLQVALDLGARRCLKTALALPGWAAPACRFADQCELWWPLTLILYVNTVESPTIGL
jgi:NADPH:quinone reductase-like Zn-dependent oxidoreductase